MGYRSNETDRGFNLRKEASSNLGTKHYSRHLDNPGNVYNKLTLVKEVGVDNQGKILWKCLCDCGNEKIMSVAFIKSGHSKSCGCLRKEQARKVGLSNKGKKYNV